MEKVTILDKHFKKFISSETIQEKVSRMAERINRDFEGKEVVFVGILNGVFIFAADLLRNMHIRFTLDFIGASSYIGKESSGDIKITKDLDTPLSGRHLILVEDIVDTGLTLHKLCRLLEQRDPASISIATLLLKEIERDFELPVEYCGFTIPNKFVVGFGLDYSERHRGLPYIGYIDMKGQE